MDLDFVAGDFFHSDPVIVGAPFNFFYLANDLEDNGADCDEHHHAQPRLSVLLGEEPPPSHSVAASNDGQLHAFDAGQFEGDVVGHRLDGRSGYGTGREVFAHMTRAMMVHTRR